MKVRTLASVDQIPAAEWNELVGENRLICRHEYLKAIEESNINDCRYFYPIVYDGDRIVAHACLYYISTELDAFAQGIVKTLIVGVRKVWKSFLILRSIECGTPVALGSTISFRPGADRAQALLAIVKETERIAREEGVGTVLFRDFYEDELPSCGEFAKEGYRRINNLPCARMKIAWSGFDEYVGSLRSEYRNKLLGRMRKCRNGGVSLSLVEDFAGHAAELAGLWKNAYDHAKEYRREMLREPFFEAVSRRLGERSAVLLARLNSRTVGFMLLLFDGTTLIPLFCGLDYESSRKFAVYFNLFYETIRIAISRRMREIDFGITSLVPKVELGACVAPLFMYMKHASPAMNGIVPRLFELMTPTQKTDARHVLKPAFNQP